MRPSHRVFSVSRLTRPKIQLSSTLCYQKKSISTIDRQEGFPGPLVAETQQRHKSECCGGKGGRHQDQGIELAVKQMFVEEGTEIIGYCPRKVGDRHESRKSKAFRARRTI